MKDVVGVVRYDFRLIEGQPDALTGNTQADEGHFNSPLCLGLVTISLI